MSTIRYVNKSLVFALGAVVVLMPLMWRSLEEASVLSIFRVDQTRQRLTFCCFVFYLLVIPG
jgi:ribosomal protein S26